MPEEVDPIPGYDDLPDETPTKVVQPVSTVGLSAKVPAQAVVTILVFVLAHYGISLDPDTSGALGVLVGIGAGMFAHPGRVRVPAE